MTISANSSPPQTAPERSAPLLLTLAQINSSVGDLIGNCAKIKSAWGRFDGQTDLLIFPELALIGYPAQDLLLNAGFLDEAEKAIHDLASYGRKHSCAILLGTPHQKDGELYNGAVLLDRGEILHLCHKQYLPNYGVFDEKRYFTAAEKQPIIGFRGTNLGVMICEDFWYAEPAQYLKSCGAEILIGIHASPFEKNKITQRQNIAQQRFLENQLPIIYVNQVGGQDSLVFDGHSFAVNAAGQISHRLKGFDEDFLTIAIDELLQTASHEGPPEEQPESLAYRAACLGLRDYLKKSGQSGVLIGLSGGVDSALAAAIAVDAVGASNVHAIMMPSRFTAQQSLDDAALCAQNLGISYEIIPIETLMQSFMTLEPNTQGLAHENLQSRLRGLILMTRSNMTGAMVVTTGNKSEMAMGYATLYGDMCGGYNPLKDIYKTEIYCICDWLNQTRAAQSAGLGGIIPQSILDRPPSAELRDNQTDQDSLPPYVILDEILHHLIEQSLSVSATIARGYEDATVKKIATLLKRAEYKRQQSAPGPKISRRDLKSDRRYPICNGYDS